MEFRKENGAHIIILHAGDEIINALESYANKSGIESCFFKGIGAAKNIELAFFDLKTKKYSAKNISGDHEICSMNGNISKIGENWKVHAHAVFSDSECRCIGGHISSAVISVTGEIIAIPCRSLKRYPIADSELKLIKL